MPLALPDLSPRVLALAAAAALSGCALMPPTDGTASSALASGAAPAPSGPAASAAASAPASTGPAKPASAAASPAPGTPPAFASVIKDARKVEGLLTMWQKDEKVWIELRPQDLSQPFFLSPKLATGIGEAGLFGGLMVGRWTPWGRPQVVEFRRVHQQVQLLARNDQFLAASGTPEARAVQAAFSGSLLGSTSVASQPHPETKAILIEASSIFVSDLLGLGITLQRQYRQGYGFDARNSAITEVRGQADESMLRVLSHFGSASLAAPQPGTPPGMPVPTLPGTLPDARSLFLTVHYSLTKLPTEPMTPRRADPRVGYFTTTVNDFGNDLARLPKQRFVNRWRLEKKDPQAELSEPVKPITFWLDRNIPLKYRDAITRGVLGWNVAFEKIGFKNALVVKQQPEDADFDTLDTGVASIRWMTNAKPVFGAIGPSHVDPRTGEILDADIGIESLSSRNLRASRAQILTQARPAEWAGLLQASVGPAHVHEPGESCEFAEQAAEQLAYALDLLTVRGELPPDSPEAEVFVQDYLVDTTLHEVGHTLGLRHNFRSSMAYTEQQLSDPAFTREHGLAGSVMEYAPINLALPGQRGGAYFQTVLGPYDFWAIEYAYKPLPAGQEAAELQRIAARSAEPQLAFGTDEDNGLGLDPESLIMDLGNDPVVFARKRLAIARELIERQERRVLSPTEDYSVLRRAIAYALRDAGRAAGVLARQLGGLRTLRDFPGSGRDPLQPVPAAQQRAALALLTRELLAPRAFEVSPALARKLATDFQERADGSEGADTDYSVDAQVLELQKNVLGLLMSDGLAARLLDAEGKLDQGREALSLAELSEQVSQALWSDVWQGRDPATARRELQREQVARLAERLLRPAASSRTDARVQGRAAARALWQRLQASAQSGKLSAATRAHLKDCAETLRLALEAPLTRAGL